MGPSQPDQRNLIMAILFSVVIIFGFQIMFAPQEQQGRQQPGQQSDGKTGAQVGEQGVGVGRSITATKQIRPLEEALNLCRGTDGKNLRLPVRTPLVTGSLCLRGAVFDDLSLRKHWTTIKKKERIHLLRPLGSSDAYFVRFGWIGNGGEATTDKAVWKADGDSLTPNEPLTLTWTNDKGLAFTRTLTIDDKYLITVTDRVTNTGTEKQSLAPFGLTTRVGEPETLGFFVLHEGGIVVNRENQEDEGTHEEHGYGSIKDRTQDQRGPYTYQSLGGWTGFSDQYWLVAMVPPNEQQVKYSFRWLQNLDGYRDAFQALFNYRNFSEIEPGKSLKVTNRLFAGAKESQILSAYKEQYNIARFEWAIDWGWFYFLTKPFLWLLQIIFGYVGNFGVAILILTVMVKIVFFPLANRSYKSMSKMKKLQPEMMKLRERYADDKQKMNQELMALYREKKINPAAGCLPILLQIPVFFALYKTLFIAVDMRHAPFFGWIQDLSALDPTTIVNFFGLLPWGPVGIPFIDIGIWPIIMGVTMYLQQKMNPPPADPMQQKIFMALPFVFTFMLATFPAGLIIYWAWNNLLSICQQWLIMKQMGVYDKKEATGNVRDLTAAEATAGSGAGAAAVDGDAPAKDTEDEDKLAPEKKAKAPTGTTRNPGRSKQSRDKPPAKGKRSGRRRRRK
ncbi:MAG: membrane protein insertase YidC [Rhodospirillaceae bacterium]|nr:membrane protein insertase YidC [Rhodospirillaceae bacterium]